MADITLLFDELETGDLPRVCMECGARRGVELVSRRFVWAPVFAPPLLRMVMTKRLAADVPLCQAHGGPRFFAHQRMNWWGLRTIAIGSDRVTIGRVHEDFIEALHRRRDRRERGELDEPAPRRRVQVGRGPGGGGAVLKGLGILVAVMIGLTAVMVLGMFVVMGGMTMWLAAGGGPLMPPARPAAPVPAAAAAVEPKPENVAVALLGAAPDAGGLGGLPWAPMALAAQKETFHLLDDAELDRALADLKSPFPNAVADAATRLAKATPAEARRKETARALQTALANPFPSVKAPVAEALGKWGTKDDAPALIQMLGEINPDSRAAAMTALASLKDERGAAAVAERLPDFLDREKARQALEAMGPVAEKAVAPLLTHADPETRVEACGVLTAVGTMASVPALEAASRDANPNVARAARDAVKAIKERS